MKHRLPILPAIALGFAIAIGAGVYTARFRHRAEPEAGHGNSSATSFTALPDAATALVASDAPAFESAEPASAAAIAHSEGAAAPASAASAATPAPRPPVLPEGLIPPAPELVERARAHLGEHATVSAKLRFRSALFGQSLTGTGLYLHDRPESHRLRYEMKTQLGEKISSLQQICDGEALWVRRSTRGGLHLARIDLRRAADAIAQSPGGAPTEALAIGGLPMLLESLTASMEFQSVREGQLGDMPMLVVIGTWKPEMLARFLPDRNATAEDAEASQVDLKHLPSHVPTQVEIHFGRHDLFPHRIDYQREVRSKLRGRRLESLATLDLFDVVFDAPIDKQRFVYQPGDRMPIDETDLFVRRVLEH